MCIPRQLFFQCGAEMLKGWKPLLSLEDKFCRFFYAFEIKKGMTGRLYEGERKQVEIRLQNN